MKKAFLFFSIIILFLSCKNENTVNGNNEEFEVSLRQEWFPYSGYAG